MFWGECFAGKPKGTFKRTGVFVVSYMLVCSKMPGQIVEIEKGSIMPRSDARQLNAGRN
jgi:hypothetical protein